MDLMIEEIGQTLLGLVAGGLVIKLFMDILNSLCAF